MDPDELLIPRYLLGRLSLEETEKLEERFLSDDAFFDTVQAAEDEMIRDYVCGGLSGSERAQFASVYLTNAHLMKKVTLAEGLRAEASRAASPPKSAEPLPVRPNRWLGFQLPVLRFVGVFATAVLAIAVWYGVGVLRSPKGDGLATPKHPVSSPIISFILPPGTSKGGAERTHRIVVPAGSRTINLQFELLAPGQYRTYRVELFVVGPTGMQPLRTIQNLAAEKRTVGWVVSLDLDSSILADGDYVARLAGIAAAGSDEYLPSYSFGVERH